MNQSFEEGPATVGESHEHIGRLESVHVCQEVAAQFLILVIVGPVTADRASEDDEGKENGEYLEEGAGNIEAEEHVQGPDCKESEVLDIPLDEQVEQDEAEGIGSEILADLKLEEAVEGSVVDEPENQGERDGDQQVVEDVVQQGIVLPAFLHVPEVGVGVEPGQFLDVVFHPAQVLLQPHNFPLLLFNEGNGFEDIPDDAIIFLLVVLIQPQVINHHEDPLVSPLPEDGQKRSDVFEDGQALIFNNTFPIGIFGVELSTLHTVVFGLVARFAGFIAVQFANAFINELVLDAVTISLLSAFTHFQLIALHTVGAIVGKVAGCAF